ncbi:hypothetical protein BV25DRAFT_1915077, partial [Artomyces pyxidatus]
SIFGDAAGEEIENVLKTAVLGSAVGAGVTGTVNGVKSLTQDKSAGTRRGALGKIFGEATGKEVENVLKTAVLGSAVGAGVTGTVNGIKGLVNKNKSQRDLEERGALSSIFGDAAGEEIENVLKTAVLGSAVGAGVTGAVKGVQSLTKPKTTSRRSLSDDFHELLAKLEGQKAKPLTGAVEARDFEERGIADEIATFISGLNPLKALSAVEARDLELLASLSRRALNEMD